MNGEVLIRHDDDVFSGLRIGAYEVLVLNKYIGLVSVGDVIKVNSKAFEVSDIKRREFTSILVLSPIRNQKVYKV